MSRSRNVLPAVWLGLSGFFALASASAGSLPDFTELVEQYGAAVVNISTKQARSSASRFHGFSIPDLPEDSPLYEFFQRFFGEQGGEELPDDEIQSRSLGSGFIISPDGYVLTNYHVVEGAQEVIVRMSDRQEHEAQVVGMDKRSDIALLKIEARGLPMVKIGTAKDLRVGEWVLAIGSPFGFERSATAGIVSAKGRNLPSENYVPFIQTDVAINPGNSGGPLFDLEGTVVGVNSQIYSRTGGFMGLSFAIPIDVAMDVAEQLRTKGRVSRGWLGVLIQDVTRELAETFGMTQPRGALIAQVLPESPAEQAGLKAGDIILAFDGKELTMSSSLPPLVGSSPVDKAARLKILRGGKTREMEVVIGELPEEDEIRFGAAEPVQSAANKLGLVAKDLTPEQRELIGLGESGGVLVEKVDEGPAMEAGIRPGDILLMLNNEQVEDVAGFKKLVEELKPGRSVAVLVQRGDGRMFLALALPKSP